ncbi:hypothetical protein BDZ89DRAFT_417988 [Hymenopellis radicata]|nr:hypothetical protein BDZ89DRAFT_417988 [Hymenopellis radicata]
MASCCNCSMTRVHLRDLEPSATPVLIRQSLGFACATMVYIDLLLCRLQFYFVFPTAAGPILSSLGLGAMSVGAAARQHAGSRPTLLSEGLYFIHVPYTVWAASAPSFVHDSTTSSLGRHQDRRPPGVLFQTLQRPSLYTLTPFAQHHSGTKHVVMSVQLRLQSLSPMSRRISLAVSSMD